MTRGWKDVPAPFTMMGSSRRPGLCAGLSNRLSSIGTARVLIRMPQLDPLTEFARERVFNTLRGQLTSWLDFFNSAECFSASGARAIAQRHPADELAEPLNEFSSRLEEGGFARLASWPLEPRRTMIAELQSMRRLEFLFSELNRYLADVPDPPAACFTHRDSRGLIHLQSRIWCGAFRDRLPVE